LKVRQGDIFWVELEEPRGSEPGYRHPYVIIQNNVFNASRINTVAACALTSNVKRAASPGNVFLKKGEANLKKDSVVNISQVLTVNKTDLIEWIGSLPPRKIRQVIDGVKLLIETRDIELEEARS